MKNSFKGITMTAGAGIIFGAFPIFTTLFVRFGGDVDTFNLYGFVLTVVFLAAYIAITGRSFRVERKAVGMGQHWVPMAERMGMATVREQRPKPDIS